MPTAGMDEQLLRARAVIKCVAVPRKVDPQTRKLLRYMFTATRGGRSRLRIVAILLELPRNKNQIALAAGMDYKAVQHHMRVMEKNRLVTGGGGGYGDTYRVSNLLEHGLHELLAAADILGRKHAKKTYY